MDAICSGNTGNRKRGTHKEWVEISGIYGSYMEGLNKLKWVGSFSEFYKNAPLKDIE